MVTHKIKLNGTRTETFGATVTSPASFLIYPSAGIVHVPALTGPNGNLHCTTTSANNGSGVTLSGMNSYVEEYWSRATDSQISSLGIAHAIEQPTSKAIAATPLPSLVNQTVAWNNQYHSTAIHLPVPFLFFPSDSSATEASSTASPRLENRTATAISDGSWNEDGIFDQVKAGVLPSEFFEHLVTDLNYKLRYPELEHCLPGKPYAHFPLGQYHPAFAAPAQQLTISSSTTITTAGCFHPEACPGPTLQAATPTPTSDTLGRDPNFPSIHPTSKSFTRAEPLSRASPQPTETHQDFKPASSSSSRRSQVDLATTSPLSTRSETAESNPNIASLIIGPFRGAQGSKSQNLAFSRTQLDGASIPMSFESTSAAELSSAGQNPADIGSIILHEHNPQSSLKVPGDIAGSPGPLTIALAGASDLVVGSKTIAPGDSAANAQGLKISLIQPTTADEAKGVRTDLHDSPGSTVVGHIPSLTVGTAILTTNSMSQYVIGSKTLTAGSPAVTIAGQKVSLAPEGDEIMIGGSTIPIPALASNKMHLPPIVINGQTFSANSASLYIIGGQTLSLGPTGIVLPQSAIPSVSGVILPDSAVITGAAAITTPSTSPLPDIQMVTIAGHAVPLHPAAVSIEGTTLSAGGPGATISGAPVSLAADGSLLVGDKTLPGTATAATIAGHVVPLGPAAVSVENITLSAGGQGVTIDGTPVSLASGGALIVGNRTVGVGAAGATGAVFTGEAGRKGGRWGGWRVAWMGFLGCWLVV
ncbi:MAG: hypothetical protein Q9195_003533 [Heterodermia aff. obscurata]